ncbi:MAG: glycosyltransferase [Cyanobacteria bacterium J06554_6]
MNTQFSPRRPTVVIYRDQLLPYSETFISAQGEAYRTFQSLYVGSSRVPNPLQTLPQSRCLTFDQCKPMPGVWKGLYKLTGYTNPQWIGKIRARSPQLIHAHFGLDGVLAMPLASRLKLPLLVTFHGYYATAQPTFQVEDSSPRFWLGYINKRGSFFRQLYFRRQQQLFDSAQCIIAVSEHIKRSLIAKGCPPEKIQVHYIGIDVKTFQFSPGEARQPCVLFVGRLVEKKGCEGLIRAMAKLQSTRPDVKLIIVGDGPLRPSLEALAAKTLTNYQFEGSQPSGVVRARMAEAQLLAAPSITGPSGETEGLPIVVLEAMAMGLPVVSTVHAGIPEAITHEKTGLLVQEGDVEALEKEISRILQTPSLAKQLSYAGRRQVETVFNLQVNARKLETLYLETIS